MPSSKRGLGTFLGSPSFLERGFGPSLDHDPPIRDRVCVAPVCRRASRPRRFPGPRTQAGGHGALCLGSDHRTGTPARHDPLPRFPSDAGGRPGELGVRHQCPSGVVARP